MIKVWDQRYLVSNGKQGLFSRGLIGKGIKLPLNFIFTKIHLHSLTLLRGVVMSTGIGLMTIRVTTSNITEASGPVLLKQKSELAVVADVT